MNRNRLPMIARLLILGAAMLAAGSARADVVTDANARAAEVAAKLTPTPYAVRVMAIVQASVFDAVNAITKRYATPRTKLEAARGASVEAAVAAATRTALTALVPTEKAAIDADYEAAMKSVGDGPARVGGIAVGERAATAVLASRADDGAVAPDTYRPYAAAATWVPTTPAAVPHWGKRRPWVMARGDEVRPGPPPALTSEIWVRDYNEIKAMGAKEGSQRTPEQTAVARFWQATGPTIYWPVVRSVADAPGRNVTENARLMAVAAMTMDDALIAVFDAKYAYNFWRPVTAIRNGDLDGSDATAPAPGWTPFIETPMHPEYPCAHCILSGSLGAVLEAEIGSGRGKPPILRSVSPTADGAERTWTNVGDFVQEVSMGRIYDGVHFRNSTEVGTAMGKKIGGMVVGWFPKRR